MQTAHMICIGLSLSRGCLRFLKLQLDCSDQAIVNCEIDLLSISLPSTSHPTFEQINSYGALRGRVGRHSVVAQSARQLRQKRGSTTINVDDDEFPQAEAKFGTDA